MGVIDYRWGKVTGGQPCLPRTKAFAMPDLSNRSRSKRAVSRNDVSRYQVSINYTRSRGSSSRSLSEEGLAPTSGPQPAWNSACRGLFYRPSLWSSVRNDLCRGRRMACRASFAWQRPGQISIDFDPFVPEVPSLPGPAKSRVPDGRRRRLVPEPPRASRCQLGDRLARTENQSDRSSPRSCDRSARKGAYKSRARACRAAQR